MIREDRELFAAFARANGWTPKWAMRAMAGETTADETNYSQSVCGCFPTASTPGARC